MSELDQITTEFLRRIFDHADYEAGRVLESRVERAQRLGDRLQADVNGATPATASAQLRGHQLMGSCTCQADGWCAHITAVLIHWATNREAFMSERHPQPLDALIVDRQPSQKPSRLPEWMDEAIERRAHEKSEQLIQGQLHELRLQDLRAVAQANGWQIRGSRKDDFIAQFVTHLTDPQQVRPIVEALEDDTRAMLQALAVAGPLAGHSEATLNTLQAFWVDGDFIDNTDTLEDVGLLLPGAYHDVAEAKSRRLLLPDRMVAALQPSLALLPPAQAPGRVTAIQPERQILLAGQLTAFFTRNEVVTREPEKRLVVERMWRPLSEWRNDLKQLAQLHTDGELGYGTNARLRVMPPPPPLAEEDVERLLPLTGDEATLRLYYHVLVSAGILLAGSPITVWDEPREAFDALSAAEKQRVLLEAYFSMSGWGEIWAWLAAEPNWRMVRPWESYSTQHRLDARVAELRQALLRILALLQDDTWYTVAATAPLLELAVPNLDARAFEARGFGNDRRYAPIAWEVRYRQKPAEKHGGHWLWLTYLLRDLHRLGVADLGWSDDALTHFRLHGLSDAFWKRDIKPLSAQDTGPMRVTQTDFSVAVAHHALRSEGLMYLQKIARLDQVSQDGVTYTLDAAAVNASFDSGESAETLLADGERLLDPPLSSAMRDKLSNWWQQYGAARLYTDVALIELGDEHALAELRAITSLEQHLIATVSPSLVIIEPSGVDILMEELRQAGYMPQLRS